MRLCPRCGDEYEDEVEHCADCHVELVAPGAPPAPPDLDALLGRFHPDVAGRVAELVRGKGIAHEVIPTGDESEVLVAAEWRDDLRAELVVTWQTVLGGLPEDVIPTVLAERGSLPGWRDAPTGAWVDREGRLQVDRPDDLDEDDARRIVGPTLVVGGITAALLGWYVGGALEGLLITLGLGAAGTGLFIPR